LISPKFSYVKENIMTDEAKDGRAESGQKSSESGRGNPDKANPTAVERYIKGINFPADKSALENQAKQNGAPEDVMKILGRFESKEYNSPVEVAKEVSRIE
jgi:hypothetical protein